MGVFGLTEYWINEVPDHLKTQEMRIKALEAGLWLLGGVPDHFKRQEMSNEAVRDVGLFFCSMSLITL